MEVTFCRRKLSKDSLKNLLRMTQNVKNPTKVLKTGRWVRKISRLTIFNFFVLPPGYCLLDHAIPVDCRDEQKQKRFFPVGVDDHFLEEMDMSYWYFRHMFYNSSQGSLNCCSDTIAGMHYIGQEEMFLLEYLVYQSHPFGVDKNITEVQPKKLKLKQIKVASKAESFRRIFERERRERRLKLKSKQLHNT